MCCFKGRISVTGTHDANRRKEILTIKNNASFRPRISEINNTFIEQEEDLDIVMTMYNLLEYSDNYTMKSGSLWNYYRDEVNDDASENSDYDNYRIKNNKTVLSKYFKYKTKI